MSQADSPFFHHFDLSQLVNSLLEVSSKDTLVPLRSTWLSSMNFSFCQFYTI